MVSLCSVHSVPVRSFRAELLAVGTLNMAGVHSRKGWEGGTHGTKTPPVFSGYGLQLKENSQIRTERKLIRGQWYTLKS